MTPVFDLVPAVLFVAGVLCIRHGVRSWAAERLRGIARTDLREWYRQEP